MLYIIYYILYIMYYILYTIYYIVYIHRLITLHVFRSVKMLLTHIAALSSLEDASNGDLISLHKLFQVQKGA